VSMLVSDVGRIVAAAESAGVASAVLVSGVPVAVAVAVAAVVACACKFVKVSIKGRAYVTTGVFIPFLLPPIIVVADDSGPLQRLGHHVALRVRWGLQSLAAAPLPLRSMRCPVAARRCWCCTCRIRRRCWVVLVGVREFRGKESRTRGSAGCGGGYVLVGVELRGKAAVVARVVMLGGGVVVESKASGVEDDIGGREDDVRGREDDVGGREDDVRGREDDIGGRDDNVGGSEDGLVAIAVEGVVGVGSAGHVAGGGGGICGGIMYQVILGIEDILTRIVHGLAIVADAKFEVAWVVVVAVVVVTVADVVADVTHCLACGVVCEVSRIVLWGLCLRLHYWVCIAIIYA